MVRGTNTNNVLQGPLIRFSQWSHFAANLHPLWHEARMPVEHGTFRNVHPSPLTTAGQKPFGRVTATECTSKSSDCLC